MRPPVLPSGNVWRKASIGLGAYWRFNEAAGFTQRKRQSQGGNSGESQKASMRPPVLPSGNATNERSKRPPRPCFNEAAGFTQRKPDQFSCTAVLVSASMRPPVLPSGNTTGQETYWHDLSGFNEAAGFTQRKPPRLRGTWERDLRASMRPPVLPSGNGALQGEDVVEVEAASMRPPVLPSGNGDSNGPSEAPAPRFNEAAGFTQRKLPVESGPARLVDELQ